MHLQARMRANDWVTEVEQPVTKEEAGREMQDHPGGEASPRENDTKEKENDLEQEKKEKEADPRSVEVRSSNYAVEPFIMM